MNRSSIFVFFRRFALWLFVTNYVSSSNHLLLIEARGTSNLTLSKVVSVTKDVTSGTERVGRIRYHHLNHHLIMGTDDKNLEIVKDTTEPSQQLCSDVLIVGVGTSMSVEDYDKLAEHITTLTESLSMVVIVSDHNLGGLIKTSPNKYADLANAIQNQLYDGLIPICSSSIDEHNFDSNDLYSSTTVQMEETMQRKDRVLTQQGRKVNIFIGGHSASGQAALEAAQKGLYAFTPSGFLGLDPFDISNRTMDFASPFRFPTLGWGFEETTCFVQVKRAALSAYQLSSPESGRVLYSINNKKNDGMTHCVFTDNGCGVGFVKVCPTEERFEWVLESVAKSFHSFVNALNSLKEKPFQKENFELPATLSRDILLFVNDDHDAEGINSGDCDSELVRAATKSASADIALNTDIPNTSADNSNDPTDANLGNSGSYSSRYSKFYIGIENLIVGLIISLILI